MNHRIRFLSLLVVFGMAASVLLLATPAAAQLTDDEGDQAGGDKKILVIGLRPGSTVSSFVGGSPFASFLTGNADGVFAGSIAAPAGGTVEIYAPLGRTTSVYVSHPETGQRFIGFVTPDSSEGDVIMDASRPLQFAQGLLQGQGLASPQADQQMEQDVGSLSASQGTNEGAQPQQGAPGLAAPTTGRQYTIQSGDTLSELAVRFETTTDELARLNNIANPDFIIAGQQLQIPGQGTPPQQGQPSMMMEGAAPSDEPATMMELTLPAETREGLPASDIGVEAQSPRVQVSDQQLSPDGSVTIQEVSASQNGWLVIHAQRDGSVGPDIGHAKVSSGLNSSVKVPIDETRATDTLYAMLHIDAGQSDVYEFPGPDVPATANGEAVTIPFAVSWPSQ